LTENAPKLSEYMYRPWDEATKKYVDDMILLHGKILNGAPITALQQASMASTMAGQQTIAPAAPAVTVVDPTVYPNIGMSPQPAAPAVPSLSNLLSTPSANPQTPSADLTIPVGTGISVNPPTPPVTPQPSIDQTASMAIPGAGASAIPGLSIGTEIPNMAPPTSVPGTASVQGIDMSSVDSILNSTAQPVAPQSAPGIGDLSAILNSTVV
jgi:hypothetical protein